MSENFAGRKSETLVPIDVRESIRLTDTGAAMLMHRFRESVPWRETAREYERAYPGRSSDDMIDVLRWVTTRASLTDTLRAQLAEARAQAIAEVKALIPSWAGYHFGDSVATDEALSALDAKLDALAGGENG